MTIEIPGRFSYKVIQIFSFPKNLICLIKIALCKWYLKLFNFNLILDFSDSCVFTPCVQNSRRSKLRSKFLFYTVIFKTQEFNIPVKYTP